MKREDCTITYRNNWKTWSLLLMFIVLFCGMLFGTIIPRFIPCLFIEDFYGGSISLFLSSGCIYTLTNFLLIGTACLICIVLIGLVITIFNKNNISFKFKITYEIILILFSLFCFITSCCLLAYMAVANNIPGLINNEMYDILRGSSWKSWCYSQGMNYMLLGTILSLGSSVIIPILIISIYRNIDCTTICQDDDLISLKTKLDTLDLYLEEDLIDESKYRCIKKKLISKYLNL